MAQFYTLFCALLAIDISQIMSLSIYRGTCPLIQLKNGQIIYRKKSGFVLFKCKRSYLLAGEKYMKCVHGQWDGEVPQCVRSTCKKTGEPVNGFVYPSHRGGVLNFYCKAGYELKGSAVVYCDGDKWSSYLPACIENNRTASLSCDFEHEDLCGWSHDINHDFDWTRHRYATPTGFIGTGPSSDHTPEKQGHGYYMYIEATSRNVNDTARLISPVYYKADNTCLELFYHMHGNTTGELRVYMKKITDGWDLKPDDAIFRRVGNQGTEWKRAFLTLGSVDDEFQIIIEAVRKGYLSDIAIDDVRIIENCTGPEYEDSTSTMNPWTEEVLLDVSCQNRCNDKNITDAGCYCNTNCLVDNSISCCPDYLPVCIFSDSVDSTEGTEKTSTISDFTESSEITHHSSTITSLPMKAPVKNQTISYKPRNLPVITSQHPYFSNTLRTKQITTKVFPITKETTKTRHQLFQTTTQHQLLPTTRDVRKRPKVLTPHPNDILKNAYSTLRPSNDEVELMSLTTRNIKSQKIIRVDEASTQSHLAIVIVCASLLLGVCITVVLFKRRYMCVRFRNYRNGSYGDSQSDVRFLTGDEVLDFTLQSPTD